MSDHFSEKSDNTRRDSGILIEEQNSVKIQMLLFFFSQFTRKLP